MGTWTSLTRSMGKLSVAYWVCEDFVMGTWSCRRSCLTLPAPLSDLLPSQESILGLWSSFFSNSHILRLSNLQMYRAGQHGFASTSSQANYLVVGPVVEWNPRWCAMAPPSKWVCNPQVDHCVTSTIAGLLEIRCILLNLFLESNLGNKKTSPE